MNNECSGACVRCSADNMSGPAALSNLRLLMHCSMRDTSIDINISTSLRVELLLLRRSLLNEDLTLLSQSELTYTLLKYVGKELTMFSSSLLPSIEGLLTIFLLNLRFQDF